MEFMVKFKTVAVCESSHLESVEKLKEVTVITNNIQMQVKNPEQKMVEQSANDLNQIREQLQDIENKAGISDQKINELDTSNKNIGEKVVGMETEFDGKLKRQEDMDKSLLYKINDLQSNNNDSLTSLQNQPDGGVQCVLQD